MEERTKAIEAGKATRLIGDDAPLPSCRERARGPERFGAISAVDWAKIAAPTNKGA